MRGRVVQVDSAQELTGIHGEFGDSAGHLAVPSAFDVDVDLEPGPDAVGGVDSDPGTARWRETMADLLAIDRAVIDDVVGDSGLLGVQADLLIRLGRLAGYRSPMNLLAGSMRVSGSSLTKLVDRLSDLGFARRDASPDDRRVVYVVLTADGVEEADRLRQRYVAVLRSRVLAAVGGEALDLAEVARRLA